MSADPVARLYSSLAHDADGVLLAAPESLRQRADRRAKTVTVVACVVIALVVAGTAVAADEILARSAPIGTVPPSPTLDHTASMSPTPTVSTSPSPTVPADAPIPDAAFLTPPAEVSASHIPTTDTVFYQWSLCRADFPSDAKIAKRRTRAYYYFPLAGPEHGVPNGTVSQTITVYQAGGAVAALAQLRAAVSACPTDNSPSTTRSHQLVTVTARGDDSLLLESTFDYLAGPTEQPPFPPRSTSLLSVVRLGDVVTVLSVDGWEGVDADPVLAERYTELAVAAINAWRQSG